VVVTSLATNCMKMNSFQNYNLKKSQTSPENCSK
jgi:hypothetical protein